MIDPVEVWVLYFSCGCVRWQSQFEPRTDRATCGHGGDGAYLLAIERRIADRSTA